MPAIWKDFVSPLILSGTVGPSGDIVLILKTQSCRHAYGVNSQRMVIMQSLLDSFAIHSINFHNHWLLKERKTTIYHVCILLIELISNDLSLSLIANSSFSYYQRKNYDKEYKSSRIQPFSKRCKCHSKRLEKTRTHIKHLLILLSISKNRTSQNGSAPHFLNGYRTILKASNLILFFQKKKRIANEG